MTGLPCPNCGSELAFLEQYNRNFCYACGRYAPEGFGDRGAKRCPMCTGILSFVTQYDRYYCFRCNAYPPEGVFMDVKVDNTPPVSSGPTAAAESALVLVEPVKSEAPRSDEPNAVELQPERMGVSPEPTPQVPPAAEPEPVPAEPIQEPVAEEASSEEGAEEVEKLPLIRAEILEAKKVALLDLCKAYSLDPTGTKEQLRERLLSYLDEHEAKKEPEPAPVQAEASPVEEAPVAPSPPVPTTTPTPSEPIAEPVKTPPKLITAAPRMIPDMPRREMPREVPPVMSSTVLPVVEPQPSRPIVVEPYIPPSVAAAPQAASIAEAPTIPAARVEHPCPRCGLELTYIPQYNRWYCYSCRAYAPKARSKFACPTCGAALRWISQYERWWCDACRRYAPADLPRPERTPLVGGSAVAVPRSAAAIATPTSHRHRNPETGISLVGFGMILFVLYEVLVDLPLSLSSAGGSLLGPDVAFGLRFFAGVFLAVGVILGLSAVRDRR